MINICILTIQINKQSKANIVEAFCAPILTPMLSLLLEVTSLPNTLFFILFFSVSFSFRSFHCCIFKLTDSYICCVQAAHELIKNIHSFTLFLIFKHFLLIFLSFSLSHLTLLICFKYCPLFPLDPLTC